MRKAKLSPTLGLGTSRPEPNFEGTRPYSGLKEADRFRPGTRVLLLFFGHRYNTAAAQIHLNWRWRWSVGNRDSGDVKEERRRIGRHLQ